MILKKVKKRSAQYIVLDSIKKGNKTTHEILKDTKLTGEVIYQALANLRRWELIETIRLGRYKLRGD